MTIFKKKTATTLIEILLYFTLLGIFLGIAISFAFQVAESTQNSAENGEVQTQINAIVEQFDRLAHEAEAVDTSASNLDSDAGSLTFQMSDSAVDPSVIYLENGRVYLQEGLDDPLALTHSELTVSQLSIHAISYSKAPDLFVVDGLFEDEPFHFTFTLRP